MTLEGCDTLRADGLRDAVELELGGVEVCRGLRLRVACTPGAVAMEVDDPVTRKRVARSVALDARHPEAGRMVALVASELVLAAWSELLLLPPPAEDGARGQALARVERARPPRAPTSGPAGQAADDRPRAALGLDLELGARARDVRAPYPVGTAALRGLVGVTPRVALGLRVGAEWGVAARGAGDVVHAGVALGLVCSVALWRRDALTLEATLEPRVGWLRLDGRPDGAEVAGRALGAVWVEAVVGLTPTWALGRWRLGVGLELGATLVGPRGEVPEPPDVSPLGLVAGLAVRVGVR